MANERDNKPLPAQWLHLLNSTHIQRKMEQSPKLKTILDSKRTQSEITAELYLTILSRFPTPDELKIVAAYGQVQPARPTRRAGPGARAQPVDQALPAGQTVVVKNRGDWVDIAWSLINSTEFLYRH